MTTITSSQAYHVILNDPSRDHTSPTLTNNLFLTSVPKPVPGPGEVLVRLRAAALNYRDLMVLANNPLYPVETVSGLVPLCDGAGEIESTGPNSVWEDSIGQGVVLVINQGWLNGDDFSAYTIDKTLGAGALDGTLRQYVVVRDDLIVKKPANLSFEEAAAIPACAATAIHALDAVKIQKGTTVVAQGTGGVSSFVILVSNSAWIPLTQTNQTQLASALGAHVIAISSSDEKLLAAKKLGASDLVNYKTTPNWAAEILKLTDNTGVDFVVDVAGAGTIQQSIAATRSGGTVALIGFLTSSGLPDLVPMIVFGSKTCKNNIPHIFI
jgi:NADPH:quinone reductase-like Zn-dependent oxidoreductase